MLSRNKVHSNWDATTYKNQSDCFDSVKQCSYSVQKSLYDTDPLFWQATTTTVICIRT